MDASCNRSKLGNVDLINLFKYYAKERMRFSPTKHCNKEHLRRKSKPVIRVDLRMPCTLCGRAGLDRPQRWLFHFPRFEQAPALNGTSADRVPIP
jgi:hypothetical protein